MKRILWCKFPSLAARFQPISGRLFALINESEAFGGHLDQRGQFADPHQFISAQIIILSIWIELNAFWIDSVTFKLISYDFQIIFQLQQINLFTRAYLSAEIWCLYDRQFRNCQSVWFCPELSFARPWASEMNIYLESLKCWIISVAYPLVIQPVLAVKSD